MTGHYVMSVPPGGGGDYIVCAHTGCSKKARVIAPDQSDHDCCGKHDRLGQYRRGGPTFRYHETNIRQP